jgi:hypothetical protein
MDKKELNRVSNFQRAIFLSFQCTIFITLSSSVYSQQKLEVAALNRVTLNRGDTTYQFYAVKPLSRIKFDQNKNYSWFVKDTILITQSGYDGKLLHGEFKVFHPNKNIIEEGVYKNGLKEGLWRLWYANGTLKQTVHWSKGIVDGKFEEFDQGGKKIRSGFYRNNLFTGHIYVYLQNGSSQKIYYQNGKLVVEKEKAEKPKQNNDKKL